jgi:hypothetical protein
MTGGARRVGVFVDYWYAYTSARQLFTAPGQPPPPPWFGNVSPRALAGVVVKRPPAGTRRSQRVLAGLHVFVRHFDPEVHRSQLERVRRWELEGATVEVGPSREEGGGHWQGGLNVALATSVVRALAAGTYDTAVVLAGDGALWPMFAALAGEERPAAAIELATWVAADGSLPTSLAGLPGVWCHRLGEATFRQLLDDRRPSHHAAGGGRVRAPRAAARPGTAMGAALAAAGLAPGTAPSLAFEQGPLPPPEPEPEREPQPQVQPDQPAGADPSGGVRRLAQRLFRKSA